MGNKAQKEDNGDQAGVGTGNDFCDITHKSRKE
jgi:hypothetical protein